MGATNKKCFVCNQEVEKGKFTLNEQVHLPVCNSCRGSAEEKRTEEEFLDSLADGLVCGCI